MTGLRVLLTASEAYPLVKTGGLADYVAAHGKSLAREGCDVRVLLPGYPEALDRLVGRISRFDLGCYQGLEGVSLVQGEMPGAGLRAWLVDCPALFDRPGGPYQDAGGGDWSDNAQRFALFARAARAVACSDGPFHWRPDILHLNDWQTGPLAALLAQEPIGRRPRTVFTLHNLAFRGLFGPEAMEMLGLPWSMFTPDGLEFWGHTSFLKAGIRYADRVTTVSEAYAREILTEPFGCGLDGVLRARADGVIGIRNGIDEDEWSPAADPHLPARYGVHDLRGKSVCKQAVQTAFGLRRDPEAPLAAYLCRLTDQKMADVLLEALGELAGRGLQIVVMGRGDPAIEAGFRVAAERFPGQIAAWAGYDEARAHLLLAGADMLLAPARFEPCGLTQMYAMRYGTVPVASRVGGLAETITDLPAGASTVADATGFLFEGASVAALVAAADRALGHYRQAFQWRRLVTNAMRGDFSWNSATRRYVELYQSLAPTPMPMPRRRLRAKPDRMPSEVLQLRPRPGSRRDIGVLAGTTIAMPTMDEGSNQMAKRQVQPEDIRQRAYELWERKGRPHGRHLEHWLQAEQELEAERGMAPEPKNTAAAPKRTRATSAKPGKPKAAPAQTSDAKPRKSEQSRDSQRSA